MEELEVLGECLGFIGINTDLPGELLPPPDEPIFIRGGDNILIKNGVIKKMKGIDFLNDVSTQLGVTDYRTILGIPIYRQYDEDKFLMAVTPQKLYYLLNDTTWTELGTITGGGNDSILSAANSENKFVFVLSNSGTIYYWDGSSYGALSITAESLTTLKARFLLEFKQYLILLRTIEDGTEQYQRFWASDAGNITNYKAKNCISLDSEGVILNGMKLGDSIIVYFEKSIFEVRWVSEEAGWGEKLLYHGVSLYAPKTLTGGEDVHYFLSQKGLMELRPGNVPFSISDQKFNDIVLGQIDPVYYYKAVAKYFPHLNHLVLCFPKSGSTDNDVQIIFDTVARELVSVKNLENEKYSSYGEFEKDLSGLSPDERKQYGLGFIPIIGDSEGYVREQKVNKYQDGTYIYESNIVMPSTFWKDRRRNKRVLKADLLIEKYTDNNISFVLDLANEMNENFGPYSYTVSGSGNQGVRRYEIFLDCFGKEFVPRIRDSNNLYGWDLHGAIFSGYYASSK